MIISGSRSSERQGGWCMARTENSAVHEVTLFTDLSQWGDIRIIQSVRTPGSHVHTRIHTHTPTHLWTAPDSWPDTENATHLCVQIFTRDTCPSQSGSFYSDSPLFFCLSSPTETQGKKADFPFIYRHAN